MKADPPLLAAGELLAPGYQIIEHMHRSNYLDVYDTWSEERACRCIAKVPRPDYLERERTVRRLLQEGELLKRFTHPHIVRAYEVLKEPRPVVILETLTGATLEYLIDTSPRRLALSNIVHLGIHLCSAIQYIHRHDILHLDLKPSNIVSERRLAKIIDFSLARPPGRSGKGLGTRPYTSPEQILGDYLSPATDVWGIGAVLFEATTDEYPFNADRGDDGEPRYEQLERRISPVRSHRRVPVAFANLVEGCLEPEPAQRPSVEEVMEELMDLAREQITSRSAVQAP